MRPAIALLVVVLTACVADPATAPEASGESVAPVAVPDTVRADWGTTFDAFGARGTFVVLEDATGRASRFDPERAATRFTPASTSKVFNALVFFDQGVVTDPNAMLPWDGQPRRLPVWNQDQSLRSALEVSAIWYFQHFAHEVGEAGYAEAFTQQPYGNSTMGEPLEMSWLDGTWRISADEQLAFMDGLRRGTLGFSPEAQATVRTILPELASGDGWRLLAKTGWGIHDGQPGIGWLVGWVERASGDVVFALNAEAAGDDSEWEMGPDRLRLARALLEQEGWLTP